MRRGRLRGLAPLLAAGIAAAAAAPADDFDRVAAALEAGTSAETAGQPSRLHGAALALAATGAVPVDGQEDLARRWQGASGPPTYRERALGPAYRAITIRAGATATFQQTFLAGQRARVAVVGLKRSTFVLSVTDDGNIGVCARTSRATCEWIPLWTTRFKLNVVNSGPADGAYFLLIE